MNEFKTNYQNMTLKSVISMSMTKVKLFRIFLKSPDFSPGQRAFSYQEGTCVHWFMTFACQIYLSKHRKMKMLSCNENSMNDLVIFVSDLRVKIHLTWFLSKLSCQERQRDDNEQTVQSFNKLKVEKRE